MQTLDEPLLTRHRLDVSSYYRMVEIGLLDPDARIELIHGEVIDMATIGTRHHSAVSRLNRLIVQATGERAVVSVQQSLRLDRLNEPEPDIAVLKPRDDFYAARLPGASDALLVIEVSDSSLAYDLRFKARLYAGFAVSHYWVIDMEGRQLYTFSDPQGTDYAVTASTGMPARLPLPGIEGAEIDLSALFG